MSVHETRSDFMRTQGFALYSDVNNRVLGTMDAKPPEILNSVDISAFGMKSPEYFPEFVATHPAETSLFIALQGVLRTVPQPIKGENGPSGYGITTGDEIRARYAGAFYAGFGDMEFPWYFPAGVANVVANAFIDADKLTREQKATFGLHDWANIIGSTWFAQLMQSMALTRIGAYASFGQYLSSYQEDTLRIRGGDELHKPLFDIAEQIDSGDGSMHTTAALRQINVRILRHEMLRTNSIGCPVARRSVRMPRAMAEVDPHVQNLIEAQQLYEVPERSDDEHVRLVQDETAIDKTLASFALHLHTYADTYGTPYADPATATPGTLPVLHHPVSVHNYLRRPAA